MNPDLSNLPDDAAALKEIIFLLQEKYQEKIDYLEQMVRLLQKEIFGRKSEKHVLPDPEQRQLFDPIQAPEPEHRDNEEKIVIPEHTRKKRGRKPLPADLPRVDVVHDIAEEDKQCGCGVALSCIGQDVSEKLDYVPAKLQVIRHIRLKYACKSCEGVEDEGPTVKIAPVPVQLIPKSIASEGLIAHLIVSKFADGLLLYRQQKISDRCGYLKVARKIARHFCTNIIAPAAARQHSVFLRAIRATSKVMPSSAMNACQTKRGITHVGCWAHARRNYVNVVKAKKKNRSKRIQPKNLADEALEYIGRLYRIEKKAKADNLDPQETYRLRLEKAYRLYRGRLFESRQQCRRKCNPSICCGTEELVVRRTPKRCRGRRHILQPSRNRKSQRLGAVQLSSLYLRKTPLGPN